MLRAFGEVRAFNAFVRHHMGAQLFVQFKVLAGTEKMDIIVSKQTESFLMDGLFLGCCFFFHHYSFYWRSLYSMFAFDFFFETRVETPLTVVV